jgi:beta propeller repeat protein
MHCWRDGSGVSRLRVVVAVFLAVLSLVPTRAAAQTLHGVETQVTSAVADQFDPALSGDLVVYTDFSGVDADVWYTDLATGIAHPVTTAPGDQQLTGVSDGKIAFTDWNTMDVLVFDTATGQTINLTNAAGSNSLDPAISHGLIAWRDDRDGNAEIYARDLATGEERRITNDPMTDEAPSVGGGLIAWERCDAYACDVYVYDWATGVTTRLTATLNASERFPDVDGRVVVYQREMGTPIDKNLVAFDLDTGLERVLARDGDQENPHISGRYVAFNDSASGTVHIGLWDLVFGVCFEVTEGLAGQYLNDIEGNRIVYSDNRAGTLDIWMYEFQVSPAASVNDLLAFFDAAVAGGELVGDGPGKSAGSRLRALRAMIEAAGDLLLAGDVEGARQQLTDAYLKTDGQPQPPDFVTGPAAAELAQRILDLLAAL